MKREGYISWDEYFMGVAFLAAQRSKDPSTQVGACIVDKDNKIVSCGYNGMPRNVNDDSLSWEHGEGLESKYLYVCHAEFNAILNTRGSLLKGCRIYVSLFPCNECAKAIIQTGIEEVIYVNDKYADTISTMASKKMFALAGIKTRKFDGKLPIVLFNEENK